jgi:hypothetical protein
MSPALRVVSSQRSAELGPPGILPGDLPFSSASLVTSIPIPNYSFAPLPSSRTLTV